MSVFLCLFQGGLTLHYILNLLVLCAIWLMYNNLLHLPPFEGFYFLSIHRRLPIWLSITSMVIVSFCLCYLLTCFISKQTYPSLPDVTYLDYPCFLCAENGVIITNTIFKHKSAHITTWTAPFRKFMQNGTPR